MIAGASSVWPSVQPAKGTGLAGARNQVASASHQFQHVTGSNSSSLEPIDGFAVNTWCFLTNFLSMSRARDGTGDPLRDFRIGEIGLGVDEMAAADTVAGAPGKDTRRVPARRNDGRSVAGVAPAPNAAFIPGSAWA